MVGPADRPPIRGQPVTVIFSRVPVPAVPAILDAPLDTAAQLNSDQTSAGNCAIDDSIHLGAGGKQPLK